jgi:hypothetical protein
MAKLVVAAVVAVEVVWLAAIVYGLVLIAHRL